MNTCQRSCDVEDTEELGPELPFPHQALQATIRSGAAREPHAAELHVHLQLPSPTLRRRPAPGPSTRSSFRREAGYSNTASTAALRQHWGTGYSGPGSDHGDRDVNLSRADGRRSSSAATPAPMSAAPPALVRRVQNVDLPTPTDTVVIDDSSSTAASTYTVDTGRRQLRPSQGPESTSRNRLVSPRAASLSKAARAATRTMSFRPSNQRAQSPLMAGASSATSSTSAPTRARPSSSTLGGIDSL